MFEKDIRVGIILAVKCYKYIIRFIMSLSKTNTILMRQEHKINDHSNIFILLRFCYYNQLNKMKQVKMINALTLQFPSKPSTESMKIKVTTYEIRIKLAWN